MPKDRREEVPGRGRRGKSRGRIGTRSSALQSGNEEVDFHLNNAMPTVTFPTGWNPQALGEGVVDFGRESRF